jgi:uncharacterized protein YkwD
LFSNSLRAPRRRLQLEELESRLVLSGSQPTAAEQLFLEQLNDARANPAAYGASIGVDLSYIAPSQPLAWSPELVQAAQLHSLDMNNQQYFGHTSPNGQDPGARMTAAGFVWDTWGESIAAGQTSTADALSALIIDAGIPDLGHRNHLLANGFPNNLQMQVGIGVVQNGSGPYANYYTIDTARSTDHRAFLTGVVFNDANGNGKYDIGEGLGNVTVTVVGAGSTTTFGSGGYSIQLNPGTYTVIVSGGTLAAPESQTFTIGTQNVRLNFTPPSVTVAQMQAWVSLLYQDVLGRTAGQGEVNGWVADLEQGMARSTIVSAFVNSTEYDSRVVTNLFEKYLNRAPEGSTLSAFAQWLQHGASEGMVRQTILSSPEYWNNHGGNASGFVQGLYSDLLGRSVSGNEANPWINLAATGNQAAVIGGILGSREFDSLVVGAMFQTYLRRSVDDGGLNAFVAYIQTYHPQHYGVEFLLVSDEYFVGASNW